MTEKRRISNIAILVILGLLAVTLFWMFHGFYLNILLGVVFAVALRPIHRMLTTKLWDNKRIAALLTIILTAVLVFVPLMMLGQMLATEAINVGKSASANFTTLDRNLDNLVESINKESSKRLGKNDLVKKEDIVSFVQSKATSFGENLIGFFGNFISIIASLIILFMTIYYTLVEWDSLKTYVHDNSPLTDHATHQLIERALSVIRAAIRGNILMIFIQAIIGGVGLFIFGVKPVILLASLYGICSLVPTIGTGTVWIPSVVFLALSGNPIAALGLTLWNVAVVGTLDNFIMPALVKKGASLHPFLVLIGVFGGISMFGLVGFIVGPTLIALTLVSIELLHDTTSNVFQIEQV